MLLFVRLATYAHAHTQLLRLSLAQGGHGLGLGKFVDSSIHCHSSGVHGVVRLVASLIQTTSRFFPPASASLLSLVKSCFGLLLSSLSLSSFEKGKKNIRGIILSKSAKVPQ